MSSWETLCGGTAVATLAISTSKAGVLWRACLVLVAVLSIRLPHHRRLLWATMGLRHCGRPGALLAHILNSLCGGVASIRHKPARWGSVLEDAAVGAVVLRNAPLAVEAPRVSFADRREAAFGGHEPHHRRL